MNGGLFKLMRNCEAAELASVPCLEFNSFRMGVLEALSSGARIAALFGSPLPDSSTELFAVLAKDSESTLLAIRTQVKESYPSLTQRNLQAHWFEREIAEQWGVRPEGHPWLKPIRFHKSNVEGRDAWGRNPSEILPCVTDYFRVEGNEVHEVAVGPVHAGVIEPGHFRFQCHGERVFNLEISLGYQHRGIENTLVGGPCGRDMHIMETLSGDSTIAHATAFCQALEALSGIQPTARAQVVRAVALELERMANHSGDLGALANDAAYLPTASYCGRIRGEYLNMSAEICGNRFGRGLVRPGGVSLDIEPERAERISKWLKRTFMETQNAVELLWDTPSTLERFEGTGVVSLKDCENIGMVGMAARACGARRDVRHNFPPGTFGSAMIPLSTCQGGDVLARARLRWLEMKRSADFILSMLETMPSGGIGEALPAHGVKLKPGSVAVSLVEGWRGETCHVALTGADGRILRYKVVDPSFHNWHGLALALRNEQISNFPLCNKSFNLSYCGHDL